MLNSDEFTSYVPDVDPVHVEDDEFHVVLSGCEAQLADGTPRVR